MTQLPSQLGLHGWLDTLITWPLASKWTLICHTTMRRNAINFLYNPGHVTRWCLEVVPEVNARVRSTITADWAKHWLWNVTISWLEIVNFDFVDSAWHWHSFYTRNQDTMHTDSAIWPNSSPNQWQFNFFEMVHLGLTECWEACIQMVLLRHLVAD